MYTPTSRIVRTIIVAGTTLCAAGCYATVRGEPGYVETTGVVYDDSGEYDYETYPTYVYEGRTVYLVGDRWYFRGPRGWAYYRDEPEALRFHRHEYHTRRGYAPPAYGAPPAYRGRYVAPPAARGRVYAPRGGRRGAEHHHGHH